jgi:hypothetical protein
MLPVLRWVLFAGVALGLFAVAMSGDVYDATSPPTFAFHVLLRKFYSVLAFAVAGAAYSYARRGARPLDAASAIGVYSGGIEIGQWLVADEPLEWNLIDVACGAAGGALGAAVLSRLAGDRVK